MTDEHVPSVFVTALRSKGYEVRRAKDTFGEGTDDETLLRGCADREAVLITHDRKDFAGEAGVAVEHAGIIYTDANFLRDRPEEAARTVERACSHYPPSELADRIIWSDQWRN